MEYTYKFRIYPNAAQQNLIQRTFGCCRYVDNHYLARRKEAYEKTGKMLRTTVGRTGTWTAVLNALGDQIRFCKRRGR